MRLPIFHVDAFASELFAGNPAAVVPLRDWLPDGVLQAIAAENALPETAFLVPGAEGWDLRWFTPTVEVDLCGHATLASAFVLAATTEPGTDRFVFATREAGTLVVTREGGRFTIDLPSRPARPVPADREVLDALGVAEARATLAARDDMVVLDDAGALRALAPDMTRLAASGRHGVIVTAPGDEAGVDFVSRYFAPADGIPEDPVTGSAHCTLVPYWADRIGRATLQARQVSPRGGALGCRLADDRVLLTGGAVLYLEGAIEI